MNIIPGHIHQVSVNGHLSLVRVKVQNLYLSAIVIDTPETCRYLTVGHPINAIFKETEVIIGKGIEQNISLQNRIEGHVTFIDNAELLSKITVETMVGVITSIITTRAVQQLQLAIGMNVMAMIKTNEVMLSE